MTYKESLAIVPDSSFTSTSLPKYDFENLHSKMQTMNEKISAMLQKLTDTGSKTNKHEEQLTEISLKL